MPVRIPPLAPSLALLAALIFAPSARAQAGGVSADGTAPPSPHATATVAVATRATRPPVIDGRDDDDVWRGAQRITDFREFQPKEDGPARFRTEARVAYDAYNLYVFVRMFDPHPDSIMHALTRRDVRGPSDQIKIMIDAYQDRRTGVEMSVNPDGVKRDYVIYGDAQEDNSWDGVWDVATTVDSLGWTAEYRVPLSQLRYDRAPTHTFGFGIWRDIERYKERVSWPVYRYSRNGLISQLGELEGIDGIAAPRRLEVMPYTVAKSQSRPTNTGGYAQAGQLSAGADVKYGLTSNLTVDATINPDFGQVEADPAVLNLREFETFLQERRPFFLEGTGLLREGLNCTQVSCSGEDLFYSRRIGRAPTDPGSYADAASSTATTILGASKLTGRLSDGLSVGVLDAVTQRETGSLDRTIEPQANYALARATQELRGGESGIGGIFTAVDRQTDQYTGDALRRGAYVGGVDFWHRFFNRRYQISGSIDRSAVQGTAAAITATQTSPVHYYQRPDGNLRVDSAATSLAGDAEQLKVAKLGGRLLHFETSWQRTSPGFEANDLGFLLRADQQSQATWVGLQFLDPNRFWRGAYLNLNQSQTWNAAGLLTDRSINTSGNVQLPDNWFVNLSSTLDQMPGTYCDHCTRGGPAIRRSPLWVNNGGFQGADAMRISPQMFVTWVRGDYGRSDYFGAFPTVVMRVSTRFDATIGGDLERNRDDSQWYGNPTDTNSLGQDSVTHYTFARLHQRTIGFTMRANYTATPDLTLQLYANPFVSRGTFFNVRELDQPRAADYTQRYKPFVDPQFPAPGGPLDFRSFNANAVIRWEYRPGSVLFVVWSQGRVPSGPTIPGASAASELGDIFALHPENTFLVKMSYWFNR